MKVRLAFIILIVVTSKQEINTELLYNYVTNK